MKSSGQSNVKHINLGQLWQRVLEFDQYTKILLKKEVTRNMYIYNITKLDKDNADLTHSNGLLQMQLNEAQSQINALSTTFTATNSEKNKESRHHADLKQLVQSQQETIAKLQKEHKQITSTNQSLTKKLEETNAKYEKLQNEYNLVTKDDTHYITELEYEIDEFRKQINAQNQGAHPRLEVIADTPLDAEDQKTEDISEVPGILRLSTLSSSSRSRGVLSPMITWKRLPSLSDRIKLPYLGLARDASTTFGEFSCLRNLRTPSLIPSKAPRFQKLPSDQHHIINPIASTSSEPTVVSKSTFEDESEIHKSFEYGEYLEYWSKGHSNSVTPKYKDLKEEMTSNNVKRISEEKYDEQHSKAQQLLKKRSMIAKQVGDNNEKCGIEEGSTPKVEHIIALLIYTDFNNHQREFKKHCRKLSANESLQDLVDRNSEIYHWSKLIKELCIFYGAIMGENEVLYTGMGQYLMFDSLCTRFECPISTSTKLDVAKRFSDGAIILKFKRGSTNTKTLDVTEYSNFGTKESERLVAGSTLQIVDILINEDSHETYVSALRMFEQIMNGHFIDGDDEIASILLSLLEYAISPTLTDKLRDLDLKEPFFTFLKDEGHDSDSITEDITEETSSDISKCFGPSIFAEVQKCTNEHAATKHPKYIQEAVFCFLRKMKRLTKEGALWLNQRELEKTKYAKLHSAFVGDKGIFDHFHIESDHIREIELFAWDNSNESCDEHQYSNETEFRTESEYIYEFDEMAVHFQFQFYRKRIDKEIECSIFLKILTVTPGIESVTTEIDIICNCDGEVYRSLMRKQKLLAHGPTKGTTVFRSKNVNANSLISWKFAVQMEPKLRDIWIGDQLPLWQSLPTPRNQNDYGIGSLREQYSELQEQYDALKESHIAVIKKLEDSADEFEEKRMKKDMAIKEMHSDISEKMKEIETLKERLKEKDELVQSKIREIEEVKQRSKKKKQKNTRKGSMNKPKSMKEIKNSVGNVFKAKKGGKK